MNLFLEFVKTEKSILVDAVHSEETRVLVLLENSIEELDFESATKAQHKEIFI